MADGVALYDGDFVRWSEEQAGAIRAAAASGTNLPLDWENIAEEIESLGKSVRSELRSRLGTVIEHLVKLEHSPAVPPRDGWIETIVRERGEIAYIVEDNPSLRNAIPDLIVRVHPKSSERAALGLAKHGEAGPIPQAHFYTVDQVIGDWLPAAPTPVS